MLEQVAQEPQAGAPAAYRWERVTADDQLARRPIFPPLLFGGVILTSDGVGAADVTVYDGQDTTTGRRFCQFIAPSGETEIFTFPAVLFDRGLYIDIGSNVADFVAFYCNLPE